MEKIVRILRKAEKDGIDEGTFYRPKRDWRVVDMMQDWKSTFPPEQEATGGRAALGR